MGKEITTQNFKKNGFTLIEILVVVTIMVLLTAAAVVSYSVFLKQARDTKRKTDLEQVRGALEIYRSNVGGYPTGSDWTTTLNVLKTPIIYMQSLPKDPKDQTYSYYYSGSETDYTVGAFLEGSVISTCSLTISCAGANCNYCLGPYGQK